MSWSPAAVLAVVDYRPPENRIVQSGRVPVVTGYHGTSRPAAARILQEGFVPSCNEYDWLGDGVYFFQDAPARARQWAVRLHGNDAVVLRSSIRLESCIDLIDTAWFNELTDAYDQFLAFLKLAKQPVPMQRGGAHRLDRHVLNYLVGVLAGQGIAVRTIRAAFIEGAPAYPGSALFTEAHLQIAVRDCSVVTDTEVIDP